MNRHFMNSVVTENETHVVMQKIEKCRTIWELHIKKKAADWRDLTTKSGPIICFCFCQASTDAKRSIHGIYHTICFWVTGVKAAVKLQKIVLMLTSAITKWSSEWTNFCKCWDGGWQCRSSRVIAARAPEESLIRTGPARSADMSGTVGWASATPSLWPRFDTSKTPDGGRGARTPLLALSFHMFYCPLFHFSVLKIQYVYV